MGVRGTIVGVLGDDACEVLFDVELPTGTDLHGRQAQLHGVCFYVTYAQKLPSRSACARTRHPVTTECLLTLTNLALAGQLSPARPLIRFLPDTTPGCTCSCISASPHFCPLAQVQGQVRPDLTGHRSAQPVQASCDSRHWSASPSCRKKRRCQQLHAGRSSRGQPRSGDYQGGFARAPRQRLARQVARWRGTNALLNRFSRILKLKLKLAEEQSFCMSGCLAQRSSSHPISMCDNGRVRNLDFTI